MKNKIFGIVIIFLIVVIGTFFKDQNKDLDHNTGFDNEKISGEELKKYLKSILPSRESVKNFIVGKQGFEQQSRHEGWRYNSSLGWVHCDVVRNNSINNSNGFYSYENDGARKIVNSADKPCRIHTYGNSFTHCDQVSDGETWQEYLAAHLQEPIRNYGVGGYSVYQAYLRMMTIEEQYPADYIILNIWADDHYRNLDSWRSIRTGPRSYCGFTLPHLRVDLGKESCNKIENIIQNPDDVYSLCNENFVWETFRNDPILNLVVATRLRDAIPIENIVSIAARFGIHGKKMTKTESLQKIREIHTEAALFATQNVITWIEQYVKDKRKKLMIILSFDKENIAKELAKKPRFDQKFSNWLKNKSYPIIDMRDVFHADYKQQKQDIGQYLDRYFIGHHSPAGNFFFAWGIKDKIVNWLDPKPLPYQ